MEALVLAMTLDKLARIGKVFRRKDLDFSWKEAKKMDILVWS